MYYFAYGSNLWFEQMKQRCPESMPITVATLYGWKLVFQECPTNKNVAANILPGSKEDRVIGAIYSITEEDRKKLDGFEKLDLDYFHQYITITTNDQSYHCLTYQMSSEQAIKPPLLEYTKKLYKGFLNWDIPIVSSAIEPYCSGFNEADYAAEKSVVPKFLHENSER
jgi:gamma-glutamylcyclotransferase (GGCT)/AIG2-like uncharacterized protein YtfP